MNYPFNPYASGTIAESPEIERARFIRKTYGHLAGAIALFAVLEGLFLSLGLGGMALKLISTGRFAWLAVLGAFMLVSWVAERWANNGSSLAMQYAGLAVYTVAQALLFLPLISVAIVMTGGFEVVFQAGLITFALTAGISAVALTTRRDLSFLGGFLKVGGLIAMGVIVASFFLPITLGVWFSAGMALFASVAILYNTNNLLHRYQPGQHVGAALSLFASVTLLFWYILQLLMRRD